MLLWAVAVLCQAFLFGAILFFSAIVAPAIFSGLPPETAGAFVRRLFPRYYLSLAVAGLIGGIAALPFDGWSALALLLVAAGAIYARQVLVPAANRARDEEQRGVPAAGVRFKRFHRLSLGLNLAQFLIVVVVLLAF